MEPWNPREPLAITPDEYERRVIEWLRQAGATTSDLVVKHQVQAVGSGGEYTLDGQVEFEILGGARITVLVECKKHGRPVSREVILGVHAKMAALRYQKAIVFSTSGFQKGAIEFASQNAVALVVFVDGMAVFHTRSDDLGHPRHRSPWAPDFAGQMVTAITNGINVNTIDDGNIEPLRNWVIGI